MSKMENLKISFRRFVRQREENACSSNPQKLAELAETSDDYLVKRALWTGLVIAGPAAFVGLPLLLSAISIVVPPFYMDILWILAKSAMALVLAVFALCAYSTIKS